jgi:prevent-host-death family protein
MTGVKPAAVDRTATWAREHFAALLDSVADGQIVYITRGGQRVAVLASVAADAALDYGDTAGSQPP